MSSTPDPQSSDTPSTDHIGISGGQRLFELASVSKARWETFDSDERRNAAAYAWGLYEGWLAFGDIVDGYDFELHVLPVLRLSWTDTSSRGLIQARMDFWARDRRETFAAMMTAGAPSTISAIVFHPSSHWRKEAQPAPVLWRDDERHADAVLSAGEVAVLAGAGKGGKSYLCIALAKAAAEAGDNNYGAACGLRIAARPVVILSYEDSPKRIDMRAASMGAPEHAVLLTDNPAPLYRPDRQTRSWVRSEAWQPTWDGITACEPALVVIDTGPKAMLGETLDPAAIIGFLQEVEREARAGNFGVLITAHDTKAARDSARRGDVLDAGVIAGSAQWHDSPRGILHLTKEGPGDSPRLLEAVKCSYGRDGWGARLSVRYNNGHYAGLELAEHLDEVGIAEARETLKPNTTSGQTPQSSRNGKGKGRLADPGNPPR